MATGTKNFIKFYYHRDAWKFAFSGNSSKIIFTTDGSVYKDVVDDDHLVVNGYGLVGPAGGVNQSVKVNDINTGAISNALEYTRRVAEYLAKQMNMQISTADWLDWIGKELFGVERLGGERDPEYALRIVDEIFTVKCSPLAIENALRNYADGVDIDDDISSGMFADVSFADYYFELDEPEIVRAAIAGAHGGLAFYFRVILKNPDIDQAQKITNVINNTKAAGVTYDIIVV